MNKAQIGSWFFGQYTRIVFAIALFIVLDVAVLTLNFYISKSLRDDAILVEAAARLQTVSQQLLVAGHQLQQQLDQQGVAKQALEQLQNNYQVFDDNLQQVLLQVAANPEQHNAAQKVDALWQGMKAHLYPVVNVPEPDTSAWFKQDLQQARHYLTANNQALLSVSEDLLQTVKGGANSKIQRLRWVQIAAISLALINFLFIVFHFITRLKANDKNLRQARTNTQQILDFVNEGLLLLDPSLKVSQQYSKTCLQIFSTDEIAGTYFTDLLEEKISAKELKAVGQYLRLLFDNNTKATLLDELNPLRKIRLLVNNEQGEFSQRFVSFSFQRTFEEGQVAHVLVTITDKSQQTALEEQLQAAKQSQTGQLDVLSAILAIDKQEFFLFVQESLDRLHKVNAILQQPSRRQEQFEKQVHQIVVELHKLKGEASMLALHDLAQNAHKMEQITLELLHQESINGEAFLPLAVKLKAILKQFDQFHKVAQQLNQAGSSKVLPDDSLSIVSPKSLDNLVQSIAQKQNKKIQLLVQQRGREQVPTAMLRSVKDIVVQLVRNAASHGIERCEDRALKPECGKIQVRIYVEQNVLNIIVRDDGQGIDLQAVKEKALASGRVQATNIKSMTEQEGFALLFEPGLSTASHSSVDAGRGMGMLAVKKMLQKLGGRIAIAQAAGEYCQFTVRLPLRDEPSLLLAH